MLALTSEKYISIILVNHLNILMLSLNCFGDFQVLIYWNEHLVHFTCEQPVNMGIRRSGPGVALSILVTGRNERSMNSIKNLD